MRDKHLFSAAEPVNISPDDLLLQTVPILAKWLTVLFWLIIPMEISSLLTGDIIADIPPALVIAGHALSSASVICYACILLYLNKVDDRYKQAGIFLLLAEGIHLLSILIPGRDMQTWVTLLAIPQIVLQTLSGYNEFHGHATALLGFDNDFSAKWETLWKWNLRFLVGACAAVLLAFFLPLIAYVLVLVCAIGSLVIQIIKLVYLYQTGRLFRHYAEINR